MISIITVVNNYEIYKKWLKSSLENQEGVEYQIVVVDNSRNQYNTLESAYTEGINKANGEWLMFAHPDIRLMGNRTLNEMIKKIERWSKENKRIQLWGIAGVKSGSFSIDKYVSSILHGEPPEKVSNNYEIRDYETVQTVDACCFIIRRDVFDLYRFSEGYCGFHMIVEDLCIRINKNGYYCAVIPIQVWHRSKGKSLDHLYFKNAIKLLKTYPEVEYFNTTTIHGKNNLYYVFKLRCHQTKQLFILIAKRICNLLHHLR